jgi:hypothetical protein
MTATSNRSGPESWVRRRCLSSGVCLRCGASANQPRSTCASSATSSAWARRSRAAGAHGAPSNASLASAAGRRAQRAHRGSAPQSPPALPITEWTRQVHDQLLGTHLDQLALGHTDRALDLDRSLDTAPYHRPPRPPPTRPPRHHPRPRPPTMTIPPPPTLPGPHPPRIPHRRPAPTDPARTPLQVPLRGTCWPSPERDAVRHPWPIPNWCSRWMAGRSIVVLRRSGTVGGRASRGCSGARIARDLPAVAVVGQVGGSAAVVDVFGVRRFAALVDKQGDDTKPRDRVSPTTGSSPRSLGWRRAPRVRRGRDRGGPRQGARAAPTPRRIRWRCRGRTRRGHGCQRSTRR